MAYKSQYQVAVVSTPPATSGREQSAVTFSNNTTSTILPCNGTTPVGMLLPASVIAGNISFNVSKDGTNFYTLTNFDGTAFSVAAAGSAAQWIPLNPAQFCGAIFIQLISSVTQTGSPTIDFSLAPIFQGIHN
jgi:hypothetical protein